MRESSGTSKPVAQDTVSNILMDNIFVMATTSALFALLCLGKPFFGSAWIKN